MPQPELITQLTDRAQAVLGDKARVLITLVGAPGSGKTTVATDVAEKLNDRGIKACVVSMDGFHYPMTKLEQQIGYENAHKYRGAPYTFDAQGVVDLARRLKHPGIDVTYPTFDHAIKDPVPDGAVAPADTRVVIFEGNYLHLQDQPWCQIRDLADDSWSITVEQAVARVRLAKRHLASGIVHTIDEGLLRADSNDIPNGVYICEHSRPAAFTFDN